jgi:hypothetical protein
VAHTLVVVGERCPRVAARSSSRLHTRYTLEDREGTGTVHAGHSGVIRVDSKRERWVAHTLVGVVNDCVRLVGPG